MRKTEETIAAWVRTARKGAGLSQEGLGAKLALELGEARGFTKANISHWETEKHSPNLRQLMAISKITGTSLPQELLNAIGDDPEQPVEKTEQPHEAPSNANGPFHAQWTSPQEDYLLTLFRTTDDAGRTSIIRLAEVMPRTAALAIVGNKL